MRRSHEAAIGAARAAGALISFDPNLRFPLWPDREALAALTADELERMLRFSNRFCGVSVQAHGAINHYLSLEQMEE